ncbi:hypothetical protein EVAR_89378_1 [Eumeta japonica]|uniref:RNase H type-1 domain-containing protein n=1 Tax=Eumeta variegata TaxID=151549 RepID=A0A4C1ZT91_EUMVA|nr:hypothetical protein EVAR_89378_1 [Eumeta japonica]
MRLSAERFRGHFCRPGARDPCISAICLTPHVPEIGYERRDLDPRRWTVSPSSGRAFLPTVAVSKAKSGGPDGWRDGGDGTRRYDSIPSARSFRRRWSRCKGDTETYHPLAHEARRDISEIVAEGRAVRLFWVRAHAGIAGNERRRARQAPPSPRRRQRTMTGFRCRTRKEMTSHLAQTLTGHGGFSQYLHRFKLKDSPYCACDPAKIQDVLHVLEEYWLKNAIVSRRLSQIKGGSDIFKREAVRVLMETTSSGKETDVKRGRSRDSDMLVQKSSTHKGGNDWGVP